MRGVRVHKSDVLFTYIRVFPLPTLSSLLLCINKHKHITFISISLSIFFLDKLLVMMDVKPSYKKTALVNLEVSALYHMKKYQLKMLYWTCVKQPTYFLEISI